MKKNSREENNLSADRDQPAIKMEDRMTSSKAVIPSRLVVKGFVLAFIFMIVILAGLVWYTWRSNRNLKALETKHFRILNLSGQIIHDDEVLTMSARMAALTGQPKWEKRYKKFEPQLDAAIKEVIKLSPEKFMSEAINLTDIANIKLVAMENRAFDLVRKGQLQSAVELLDSQEYREQKQIYSKGIHEISEAICSREETRIKNEQWIALITITLLIITVPLGEDTSK